MGLVEYLRAFRRRWFVILATIAVAVAAAWFTTATIAPVAPPTLPAYQASTLLLPLSSSLNVNALAVVATIEPVATRAAIKIDFDGDPLTLREGIQASPDSETGFLTITAFAFDPTRAERRADAFASALIAYLDDQQRRASARTIAALDKQIEQASEEGDQVAVSQLEAQREFELQESASSGQFIVLQRAVAERVESTEFRPPDSRAIRIAVAGVIGLLAGAGLALLLERLDTKVRTSEHATDRFGYPVLAEIPPIRRDQRKGIVTADNPTSPASDAFRLLGAGVHVAARPGAAGEDEGEERGRIVLVTSSGPAEGKSTVVANLAAVLAEESKRVIVFSADLRRPTLHMVLDSSERPGLVQAAGDRSPSLREYRQWTRFDRVYLVPSGGPAERPGEILASPAAAELLRQATDAADWVLIDTAPILVAGESAPLFEHVDLVLLVARIGMTSNRVAERTRDTLHRLGADAAWVVLNGAREDRVPTGYRRYQVQAEKSIRSSKRHERVDRPT
jgi:capsular exopolysaccharide synthesis family protein